MLSTLRDPRHPAALPALVHTADLCTRSSSALNFGTKSLRLSWVDAILIELTLPRQMQRIRQKHLQLHRAAPVLSLPVGASCLDILREDSVRQVLVVSLVAPSDSVASENDERWA